MNLKISDSCETATQDHISLPLTKPCTENHLWKNAEHTDIWLRPGFQSLTSVVAFFKGACWTIFISDGQVTSFTARTLPTCPYNSFEKQLGEQGDLALPCSFPLRRIVQVQELTESRKNNIPLQYAVKRGPASVQLVV